MKPVPKHAGRTHHAPWLALLLLLVAAGLILLVSSASSPLFYTGPDTLTERLFTGGRQILAGRLPYVSTFGQDGPLAYALFALAALVSPNTLWGVYGLNVILLGLAGFCMYKTALLYMKDIFAWCTAFCTLCLFASAPYTQTSLLLLPFLCVPVYTVLKMYLRETGDWSLVFTGLACGCAAMIRLEAAFCFIPWLLFVLLHRVAHQGAVSGLLAVLWSLIGTAIPVLGCVFWFILSGGINEFLEMYVQLQNAGFDIMAFYTNWQDLLLSHFPILIALALSLLSFLYLKNVWAWLFVVLSFLTTALTISVFGTPYAVALLYTQFGFGFLFWLISLLAQKVTELAVALEVIFVLASLVLGGYFLFPKVAFSSFMAKDAYTEFVEILQRDRDASVLTYGTGDLGLYRRAGLLPDLYYYADEGSEKAKQAQSEYIEQKKPDYILVQGSEQPTGLNTAYRKAASRTASENGTSVMYTLYERKD